MTDKNPVRLGFANMVDDKRFDNVILVLIIGSSVMLALDSPFNNPDGSPRPFQRLNAWLTILFVAEMASKIIAVGFILRPKSLHARVGTFSIFAPVSSRSSRWSLDDPALNLFRAMRALPAPPHDSSHPGAARNH